VIRDVLATRQPLRMRNVGNGTTVTATGIHVGRTTAGNYSLLSSRRRRPPFHGEVRDSDEHGKATRRTTGRRQRTVTCSLSGAGGGQQQCHLHNEQRAFANANVGTNPNSDGDRRG